MKGKLKLDSQQLKQFALDHVEKGVFGLLALFALLLIFKSFGLEKFTKRPDDLRNVTSRAQQAMQTSATQAAELVHSELKPKQYLAVANKNTEKFKPDGFSWAVVKPSVYPTGGKRQEPIYLAVQDLQAHAERAVFRSKGALAADGDDAPADAEKKPEPAAAPAARPAAQPGGRQLGGRPLGGGGNAPAGDANKPRAAGSSGGTGLTYVVVTGKVPYSKQIKEYREALGSAEFRLPTDSAPDYYARPIVERAELKPGSDQQDLKWIPIHGQQKAKDILTRISDPYLDPRFQHRVLTESLWDLASGEWEPESVVPEEFRSKDAAATEVAVADEALAADAAADDAADAAADDEPSPYDLAPGSTSRTFSAPSTGGGRSMDRPASAARPAQPGAGGRPLGQGGGGRPLGQGGGGGRPLGQGGQGAAGARAADVAVPEYLMFRFFDFSAEPGKRYRYRVRLFLRNPNLGVEPRYLEAADLAQKEHRYTDLSDPTPPVSVPSDGTILAGMYKPPTGPKEAAAQVVLTQFIPQGGRTAVKELVELFRGQLANEEADDASIVEPDTGELVPADEKVKFRNNLMLLDVTQAERNQPADVLVMNGEGKLMVISAQSEQELYQDIRDKLQKAKLRPRPKDDKKPKADAFGS